MDVYINDLAVFFPNAPVDNDAMEKILGMVNDVPSKTRRLILRNNKIRQRYYALDPETGRSTHSNAQMAAEAVKRLRPYDGFDVRQIECLSCGTSSADQIMPGHASMVHGALGSVPCEVVSTSGICVSSMAAMKYAYMSVALGQTRNAVATGSEYASSFMRSRLTGNVDDSRAEELENNPALGFEADFLRWMLSDGAGAAYLSPSPNASGLSLKIDWIDIVSFASQMETCMYAGAVKNEDGTTTGWRDLSTAEEVIQSRSLLIKQDVKLLNKEIIYTSVDRTLPRLIEKHNLTPDLIDWYLPHYSSDYFRMPIYEHMRDIGFEIPFDRWFTNLYEKGNTGAASIYIILEELFHSGKLKPGQKILCFIPESGRFMISYMMLTVV